MGQTEETGNRDAKAVRLRVSGEVQGVGFRYFVVRAAESCGVVGFVRNLSDGDVEVRAEGSAEALGRLEIAVRRGPRHARVEHVERFPEKAEGRFHGFDVRF